VWEILSSKYVVKDRWLTLRSDHCCTAAGQLIAPEYPPWINVLALTPEHNVVLINQYRHGIRQVILELPGGAVDEQDASILQAAQRELCEETGYAAEEWREIGTLCANPVNHSNTILASSRSVRRTSPSPSEKPLSTSRSRPPRPAAMR
jgi:hypothetical protein